MLRLIKNRREAESFKKSLGLFNIFHSDQDRANWELEENYWSSKIRIVYTTLTGATSNLEVWLCSFVLLME